MTKSQALPVETLTKILGSRWTRSLFFLLCLVPLFRWVRLGFMGNLTANPIQFLTFSSGDWMIRFLILTLAITPLPHVLNEPQLFRYRRIAGWFAIFYGFVHLSNCIWLDKGLYTAEMWNDIFRQPLMIAGVIGLVMVAPLSVTPSGWWVRRLSIPGSLVLHQAIYAVAGAGAIYYYWTVRPDIRVLAAYGTILSVLLLYRAALWFKGNRTNESESDLRARVTSSASVE